MSSFEKAVIQQEEYLRQAADGTIPAGVIRRRYGERLRRLKILSGVVALGLAGGLVWYSRELSNLSLFGSLVVIAVATGLLWQFLNSTLVSSAVHEITEMSEIRATRERRAAQQAALVRAEQEQRQAALLAETNAQRRALFEFRFKALKFMEDGVLELLQDARDREEWVPETLDEERIFEVIRDRIRASAAPEFGILRRSFNPRVVMVLGDLSCLPPEPSDDLLAVRQLPPVVQLLR